jgi:hypothetical protein
MADIGPTWATGFVSETLTETVDIRPQLGDHFLRRQPVVFERVPELGGHLALHFSQQTQSSATKSRVVKTRGSLAAALW